MLLLGFSIVSTNSTSNLGCFYGLLFLVLANSTGNLFSIPLFVFHTPPIIIYQTITYHMSDCVLFVSILNLSFFIFFFFFLHFKFYLFKKKKKKKKNVVNCN